MISVGVEVFAAARRPKPLPARVVPALAFSLFMVCFPALYCRTAPSFSDCVLPLTKRVLTVLDEHSECVHLKWLNDAGFHLSCTRDRLSLNRLGAIPSRTPYRRLSAVSNA